MSQYFFPPEFVADLREQVDIVEIVRDYVSLTKSGANYKGLCPFHREKTPSFMVHQSKGIYHCFGCGEGGDAVSFLRKIENLTYPEAILRLALRFGIDVSPYEKHEKRQLAGELANTAKTRKQQLAEVVEKAHSFYRQQFKRALNGKLGSYLVERGIPLEYADKFQLGYAPDGWDNLLKAIKKSADLDTAVQAGLIVKKENGKTFDRFRDRLLFPIRDVVGNVVGFGGRTLAGGEPKYLNSPESPLFYKRRLLYDLFYAKRAIGERKQVFLVEGYMDALSLYVHGIDNVVATLGTAFSPEHLALVKRYTERVVVFFDNDSAGLQAAFRALSIFLSAGIFPAIVIMPPGIKDPDQLARELPAEELRQTLGRQVDLFTFYLQQQEEKVRGKSYADRLQVLKEMVTMLATLPERGMAGMALRSVAERFHLAEEVVLEVYLQETRKKKSKRSSEEVFSKAPTDVEDQIITDPEEMLVGILCRFPALLADFQCEEEFFLNPVFKSLLTLLLDCCQQGTDPLRVLSADGQQQEELISCYSRLEMLALPDDKAIASQALKDCYQKMKQRFWRRREAEIDHEIMLCTDEMRLTELLRHKMTIKNKYCQ